MEIWYTYVGDIKPDMITSAINWINAQFYEKKIDKLKLFISSNGGDLDSAIRFYDYLKAIPAKVETYGFGQVDSSALMIFLAGEKRYAISNCRFRIHTSLYQSGSGQRGTPINIHEEIYKFLCEIERRSTEIVAKEIGMNISLVKKVKNEGRILNTLEAQKMKIIIKAVDKLPLVREK